ncbi:MAG TPA: hypothetical protein VEI02_13565 [Planctomycetota bacterium]|nr:hypothetical protein [Planctomycetota bacterium]
MHGWWRGGCLIAACWWTGCAAAPDPSGFVESTRALATAVKETGKVAGEALHDSGMKEEADRLREAWKARDDAMNGMSQYADSVAGVVQASEAAGDAARAFADKVAALAFAAGLPEPGSGVAAVVSDAAAFVWKHVARARAARTLEAAMTEAQPAITRIADKLADDMEHLNRIGVQAFLLQVDAIRDAEGYVALDEERRKLKDHLARMVARAAEATVELAVAEAAAVTAADAAAATARVESARAKLARNGAEHVDRAHALLTRIDGLLEDDDARLAGLRAKIVAFGELRSGAAQALAAWSAAHAQLLEAVRAGRGVDASSLVEAVVELRALIRKARES